MFKIKLNLKNLNKKLGIIYSRDDTFGVFFAPWAFFIYLIIINSTLIATTPMPAWKKHAFFIFTLTNYT